MGEDSIFIFLGSSPKYFLFRGCILFMRIKPYLKLLGVESNKDCIGSGSFSKSQSLNLPLLVEEGYSIFSFTETFAIQL